MEEEAVKRVKATFIRQKERNGTFFIGNLRGKMVKSFG
jgi:hypothetical protein